MFFKWQNCTRKGLFLQGKCTFEFLFIELLDILAITLNIKLCIYASNTEYNVLYSTRKLVIS